MSDNVFISVGHGGSDPGTSGNGLVEKTVNLAIAQACREVLERHGVNVLMSRYGDEEDKTKVAECNKFLGKRGIAVDIHNNAGGGDGVEIFHYSGGGLSKTAAQNVINEIIAIGQNSRGLKTRKNSLGREYYAFIRNTIAPAIIVECAFLDNAKDVQIIDTLAEQRTMGIAIAKGILRTLGIAYVEEKPVASTAEDTSGKLYRVQVGAYKVKANAEAMQKKLKEFGINAIIV
jgi:N-acetylmuramoyl-L-alanine amidase